MTFVALSPEQITAFADLLLDRFEEAATWPDLDTVISLAFGRQYNLARDIGDPATIGVRVTVAKLLDLADERGGVPKLAAALQAHPPTARSFADWIKQALPELAAQEAGITAQIQSIQGGVDVLRDLRIHPRIRPILQTARVDFRHLAQGVQNLAAYKDLHDALHTLQLKLLRQVRDTAREMARGGAAAQTAVDTLDGYLIDLHARQVDIEAGLIAMQDDRPDRRAEMERLVESLERAAEQLLKAVTDANPTAAYEGSIRLSGLVREQAPRLNFWLIEAARALPIDSMIETFTAAAAQLSETEPQRAALQGAAAGLLALVPEMRGYVLQHEAWQKADTIMWIAEDAMERADANAMTEFGMHWPELLKRVEAICGALQERWAVNLRRLASEFEVACPLPCTPPAPTAARGALERYLAVGRQRFYIVDKELQTRSAEIRQLSSPFAQLFSDVAE